MVKNNSGLDKRVTYRRRHTYRTLGNRLTAIRTPGGRLAVHELKKRKAGAFTPGYHGHQRLHGIKNISNTNSSSSYKNARSVSRAYGGVLSGSFLRERIVRAFLVEEQRIVKKLLSVKGAKSTVTPKK